MRFRPIAFSGTGLDRVGSGVMEDEGEGLVGRPPEGAEAGGWLERKARRGAGALLALEAMLEGTMSELKGALAVFRARQAEARAPGGRGGAQGAAGRGQGGDRCDLAHRAHARKDRQPAKDARR